jgi:hypothetical protein
MMAIFLPSKGPDSWQELLADPEKQWRMGFSARTLAHCWETARGLPPEIVRLFGPNTQLLVAIPEHKVDLPGGRRPSQTDLFAILRRQEQTIACAIEGKVNEAFGPTIEEWQENASPGKQERLDHICGLLGIAEPLPPTLRYQLLHRTASAIIEAQRFKTDEAAMIVHSFSSQAMWFDDFLLFSNLLGLKAERDKLHTSILPSGLALHLAWASGDPAFLLR